MYFYNFYLDKDKTRLVWRTESGWSEFQQDLKLFNSLEEAHGDFFQLLWDNESFRQGNYINTNEKKKEVKERKNKPVQEKQSNNSQAYSIPEDFRIELDKVYNIDCLLFMQTVPKGYFDYIITSPPYNVGERTDFGKNNAIYKGDTGMYDDYEDKMSPEQYEEWLFKVIDEMIRVTKKHVFMNIQQLANNKLTVFEIFHRYKHQIKDIIIWNKTISSPNINKKVMSAAFEYIFIFSNDNPEKRNFEDLNKPAFKNVIRGLNSSQNQYRHLNKATYPLYLPRTIIQAFGKPKDIWYDPFNGTGTTFHACELEDRHYVGTEIDADQVESSNNRVWVEKSQQKIDFSAQNFSQESE